MLLADEIVARVGTSADDLYSGAVSQLAEKILDGHTFVIEQEALSAVEQVAQSKPSSLLAALPLCRLPFRTCWLEWSGYERAAIRGNREPLSPEESVPARVGVLLESVAPSEVLLEYGAPSDQMIGMTFAWLHSEDTLPAHLKAHLGALPDKYTMRSLLLNIPLAGILVDWSKEATALHRTPLTAAGPWDTLSPAERTALAQLFHRMGVCINPIMHAVNDRLGVSARTRLMRRTEDDLSGELPCVIAALCLLNSRNCVRLETADLSRLNKSRRRRGRPPKVEYSIVRIDLSKSARRASGEAGISDHAMRQHIVRGHFKIRSGGIYWWRPHLRGSIEAGEVRRAGYEITATSAAGGVAQ